VAWNVLVVWAIVVAIIISSRFTTHAAAEEDVRVKLRTSLFDHTGRYRHVVFGRIIHTERLGGGSE